ncbi:cyclase family protein [Nonomuraea roseoviolacea]|uniref:Kynurenine formamidase n=1 Tax=Nonomuraea roseoviolacea subsp. carminata TaxID=160689 RepID=A0ABT1JTV7_9ACTN|nr:cyclase family protein [Nonomuraea roseoviolacea]MCP2345195.1 kynurenine formamidase [Nonomuraea roseoviolacea subsp. carminata]
MTTELVDLSVPIATGMPVYPGDPEVALGPALTAARDGVNVLALHLGSQSGTHVDAPFHIDDALPALDELPLERFAGPAVVVDARGREPRAAIGPEAFEGVPAGGVPPIVLVATGWSAHWGSEAYAAHPYLTEEAARLLVDRGVRTVGIDALSVDPSGQAGPAEDFPAHRVLCGAHAVIAENLTGLDRVLAAQAAGRSVEAWLLPLRLPGADGAPVRAVARLGPV